MNSNFKFLSFLPLIFTILFSPKVFSDEFYCSGEMEVSEGNEYFKVGKSPINFGIEIVNKKVVFYYASGEMLDLSLVNYGKYLETKNSVSATNNKFFLNTFISKSETEDGTDNNKSGSYHTFHFDKKKEFVSLTIQSWNHLTKNDEFDDENFTYTINGNCEKNWFYYVFYALQSDRLNFSVRVPFW